MADRLFPVVGDGNIVGNGLTNVGNHTVNIYPPERRVPSLDSCVSFDALLNSDARYPAPKCHRDTRERAQNVVKGWLCRKGEGWEKGIMWMSGAPGVGKSAVVQTSCEDLAGDDAPESSMSEAESSNHDVDGCFFFARGVESRANMKFFPPTIAYQVARSRASCRVSIDKTIAQDPHILKAHFPSQFRRLLLLPAKHLYPMERPITIAIDGLDECASVPDQVELLGLILEAVKTTRMRFLIASRPEQHIHAFFHRGDVSQHTLHVRLDEETFNTSQDIKIFLREEFARIRRERPEACPGKLPNGEDWPGERVLNRLTVKSDSQFMIPILSIGFIDTPSFPPDKQLQVLLAAPPSCAFSAIDTLYHKILSRRTPAELLQGEDDLREYQEVLMGILRVIIAWSGKPLSAAQIAMFLDKPVEAVQAIVRGPMRTLLKFHTPDHDSPITLCHKSLRDYLLDQKRSEEFFIPSAEEDDLFIALLTRPTSSALLMHTSSPNILMDVLAAVLCKYCSPSVRHIATFLGMDPIVVEHVVISGPTSVLFHGIGDTVGLDGSSLYYFLRDANRSGALFISERRKDALLIRFLSRLTPPSPPYTYSQSFVLDVFAIVMDHYAATPASIAALLDVDTSIVEHVVRTGPSTILFEEMHRNRTVKFWSEKGFQDFLEDPYRSGEFFVSRSRLDPVFRRILSRQPLSNPSPSYYRDTLVDVLAAMVALGERSSIQQIASLLHIEDTVVEGIVTSGPTKPLFCMTYSEDGFTFSVNSFGKCLQSGNRYGAFFVSDARSDALFIQSLSRPDSPPSYSYFPNLLVDILAVVLWARESRTVEQISAFLEVDRSLVKDVVEVGVVECLLRVNQNDVVEFPSRRIAQFLADAERSGEFFVSDRRLDPIFLRILSYHTASDPSPSSSHEILMDVMTAILLFEGTMGIEDIASLLDIDDTLVEGVVTFRPTNVLFCRGTHDPGSIYLSTRLLEPFLQDAARSKDFFISQSSIDALLIRILSHEPASGPSKSHSRNLMTMYLTPFTGYPAEVSILMITSFVDYFPPRLGHVGGVFRGSTQNNFRRTGRAGGIRLFSPSLISFLKDVNRSGELCITQRMIDAFFTNILSPRPPSDPPLSYSKTLLMDVLTVFVSFPYDLTVSRIASALEVDSQVIGFVVLGPLCAFLEKPFHTKITDPPYIDFLMNADRSGEFFVSPERIDALFTRILSHQPHSRDVLMGVLTIFAHCADPHGVAWSTSRLATFLDVSPALIDGAISVGLSRLPFVGRNGFRLSTPLLVPFLKDARRSAEFCISDRSLDPFFSRILSSPSPPSPPGSSAYSWNAVLKDVLTITLAVPEGVSVLAIAAALGTSPSVVESVVQFGPTASLFTYGGKYNSKYFFSFVSLVSFLRDRARSVDFYISDTAVDALFIRILSLPPPPHLSHFHFKDVLLGVMAVILASMEPCTVPKIAALLKVDRNLVEGVVKIIPASMLFDVEEEKTFVPGEIFVPGETLKITISSPLLIPFLHDAHRSGEFFIPPTMTLDDIPKPWLQHPSTVVDELGDGGRENEMKWKLSLSAPSRSGSLDTGGKATSSTDTKRPRASAAPPIVEDGAWVSEVFPMDAGGSEGDTLWNISDEARRAWAVHFEPPSEENTVLADEFWSGGDYGDYGLDYPLAPIELVGGHVSGLSVANEGYISSGFDEGDNPWAEGL